MVVMDRKTWHLNKRSDVLRAAFCNLAMFCNHLCKILFYLKGTKKLSVPSPQLILFAEPEPRSVIFFHVEMSPRPAQISNLPSNWAESWKLVMKSLSRCPWICCVSSPPWATRTERARDLWSKRVSLKLEN